MELNHSADQPSQSHFPVVEQSRPPYSYKELIIKAFELANLKPLELRDIYFLITGIFPYYKPGGAWQSAVRHVLLSDPMFFTDPGTNLWRIISNLTSQTQALVVQGSSDNGAYSRLSSPTPSYMTGNSSSSSPVNTDSEFFNRLEHNNRKYYGSSACNNSNVSTISSYSNNQPRMSSFESSKRFNDVCSIDRFQHTGNRAPITNYKVNWSEEPLSHQCSIGDIQRNCRSVNENNFKLNSQETDSVQTFSDSYNGLTLGNNYFNKSPDSAFTSISSYPLDTHSKPLLGCGPCGGNAMENNSMNQQSEGVFNRYSTQSYDNSCDSFKYSEFRNKTHFPNLFRNYNLPLDHRSYPVPLNAESCSYANNYFNWPPPEDYYACRFLNIPAAIPNNQISNQLISVNIHSSPCLHQTQNCLNCDKPAISADSVQNNLSSTTTNYTGIGNYAIPADTQYGNTINSPTLNPSFHASLSKYGDKNLNCPSRSEAFVNCKRPTLNSVNDIDNSMISTLSSSSTSQNQLESDPGIERRRANWETSLININIHLSALENSQGYNITSGKPSTSETAKDLSKDVGVNVVSNIDKQGANNSNTLMYFPSSVGSSEEQIKRNASTFVSHTPLDASDTLVTDFAAIEANTEANTSCSSSVPKSSEKLNIKMTESTSVSHKSLQASDSNTLVTDFAALEANTEGSSCSSSILKSPEELNIKLNDSTLVSRTPLDASDTLVVDFAALEANTSCSSSIPKSSEGLNIKMTESASVSHKPLQASDSNTLVTDFAALEANTEGSSCSSSIPKSSEELNTKMTDSISVSHKPLQASDSNTLVTDFAALEANTEGSSCSSSIPKSSEELNIKLNDSTLEFCTLLDASNTLVTDFSVLEANTSCSSSKPKSSEELNIKMTESTSMSHKPLQASDSNTLVTDFAALEANTEGSSGSSSILMSSEEFNIKMTESTLASESILTSDINTEVAGCEKHQTNTDDLMSGSTLISEIIPLTGVIKGIADYGISETNTNEVYPGTHVTTESPKVCDIKTKDSVLVSETSLSEILLENNSSESINKVLEENAIDSVPSSDTKTQSSNDSNIRNVRTEEPSLPCELQSFEASNIDTIISSSKSNCSEVINQSKTSSTESQDISAVVESEPFSSKSLEIKKLVKGCSVVLERIRLPDENSNSSSEQFEESAITHGILNTCPLISDQESEDAADNTSLSTTLPDNNQSTARVNSASRRTRNRKNLPAVLNGYTKPSYNYCQLITQALAVYPDRKATAHQICEVIASKQGYYKHLSPIVNWEGSIFSALKSRKKFFKAVGTNENQEQIWSFNPTFEQYMLEKWVPKYIKNSCLSKVTQDQNKKSMATVNTVPVIVSVGSVTQATVSPAAANSNDTSEPFEVSSSSLSSGDPVIEFAGSHTHGDYETSTAVERPEFDPLGSPNAPEASIADPDCVVSSNIEDDNPWEPEVTVLEESPNPENQKSQLLGKFLQEESPNPENQKSQLLGKLLQGNMPINVALETTRVCKDFSLDNLQTRHLILKEEIFYRVNFNKVHKSVEKFRLHCTVCDDHLGTSGTMCRKKARFHPTLGVLVCRKCYEAAASTSFLGSPFICQWCAKKNLPMISCPSCPSFFCQKCIECNFGKTWALTIMTKKDWKCFLCDTKQIWPHRAITYFLYRHYRGLKKNKDIITKNRNATPREIRFFIQDLSTCCKYTATGRMECVGSNSSSFHLPLGTAVSTIPSSFASPVVTNPVFTSASSIPITSSQQPIIVIEDQSPNYIYVQTSSSIPSVTLNTGTQYIHNVYPDKNCVVMESVAENIPTPSNISHLPNTVLYNRPPAVGPRFPVVIPHQSVDLNVSSIPEDSLWNPPPPSYPSVGASPVQSPQVETTEPPQNKASVGTINGLEVSKTVASIAPSIIVSSSDDLSEETIIIPDVGTPTETRNPEDKAISPPILTARERIERRPMPKSKKQSLLRTVLMNESIESMKRHLQIQSDAYADVSEAKLPNTASKPNETEQNVEEPILKSIIQTATDRLMSIHRKQNFVPSIQPGNAETLSITNTGSGNFIDLSGDENPPETIKSKPGGEVKNNIPKIKIKTLKELQDPEVFNEKVNVLDSEQRNEELNVNRELNICKQRETDEKWEEQLEVNVTGLKQGIIEASRTLINTQKKFKELAKIIASNLTYKPDQAVELITQFHDILNSCRQQLDQIDNNVKRQFGHLTTNNNIDLILESIKNTSEEPTIVKTPNILKQKRKKMKKSRIHEKRKIPVVKPLRIIENPIDRNVDNFELNEADCVNALPLGVQVSNLEDIDIKEADIQSLLRRKGDLLDFNPLGKKIILGSPEITEEDLKHIPNTWNSQSQFDLNLNSEPTSSNQSFMQELRRRQQILKKAWKKKNIWLTTRRKKKKTNRNKTLQYNEDGTVKKRRYKMTKRRKNYEDDDDEFLPQSQSGLGYKRRKRMSGESSKPIRSSARMHPSTVARVAQLMPSTDKEDNVPYFPVQYVIKPCSVLVHRLDSRIVHLLEKRVHDLNKNDSSD